MLKKMLCTVTVTAISCFGGVVANPRVNIAHIDSTLPHANRLAVLEYNVREVYRIPHTEQLDRSQEISLVNAVFNEGQACITARDFDTFDYLLELLEKPGQMFHFTSRYEQGEFASREEYVSREKEVKELSKQKAKELDELVERSSLDSDAS